MRFARKTLASDGGVSFKWVQPNPCRPEASCQDTLAFKYFQFGCGDMVDNSTQYQPLIQYILQVAHTEPAIWHATVALRSLQQPVDAPQAGDGPAFGLQHYGKAVRILNEQLTSGNDVASSIVLASSMLFATFEIVQKDFAKGSRHVNGSLNYLCSILESGRADTSTLSASGVFSSIVDSFARLEISTSIFGGCRTNLCSNPFDWVSTNITLNMEFKTLDEAGNAMLLCLAAMRQLQYACQTQSLETNPESPSLNGELELSRQKLLCSIAHWQAAVQQLEQRLIRSGKQRRPILLKIYIKYCEILVSTLQFGHVDENEMRYDNFITEFAELLVLSREFLDLGDIRSHEQGGLRYPSFTIHVGIIHIAWFIAIKCRDPMIRRGALKVLKGCDHQAESTFDGVKIAKYAEMVIKLEEDYDIRCAVDVGVDRRLRQPSFNTSTDDGILHTEKGSYELIEECMALDQATAQLNRWMK